MANYSVIGDVIDSVTTVEEVSNLDNINTAIHNYAVGTIFFYCKLANNYLDRKRLYL